MSKKKKKKKETDLERFKRLHGRIPLPKQTGGPHSEKKGEKGYDRNKEKKKVKDETSKASKE
ncbi:MAG: hypothetical protein ACNFW9_04405 [Candidatus Kerfeldbacteria bacterium]